MRGRTAGLVMAELLPALTLGMLIALAAIALLLTATSAYRLEEEATRLEETGRYAIESIARAVRQAGYEDYASAWSRRGAAIAGWDAASVGRDGRVEAAGADAVNGSDVLELRFMGSADGVLRNCAGFPVAESDDPGSYAGQSTFFIGRDGAGEPELRCRYRGKANSGTDALASGVESFQVLYGLDADGDGLPDAFVAAGELDRLDRAAATGTATGGGAGAGGSDRRSHWEKIVAVRLGVLARGMRTLGAGASPERLDLFGAAYAQAHLASDPGTSFLPGQLPTASRNRLRKVFTATVYLRNRPGGGAS